MSIEQAHEHAVHAMGIARHHAQKAGLTDLDAALAALDAAAEAGIPAAQGADLAAQGDATRDIFHALATVQKAGMAVDKNHAVHRDVVNIFNAMENVANAVHQANKARLLAAISG